MLTMTHVSCVPVCECVVCMCESVRGGSEGKLISRGFEGQTLIKGIRRAKPERGSLIIMHAQKTCARASIRKKSSRFYLWLVLQVCNVAITTSSCHVSGISPYSQTMACILPTSYGIDFTIFWPMILFTKSRCNAEVFTKASASFTLMLQSTCCLLPRMSLHSAMTRSSRRVSRLR